jgi:phosphatidylglycerophosphatase A
MGHRSNQRYADAVASLPVPAQRWPRWIVSGGGAGFLRPAPGSWGTIPPATLYCLMLWFGPAEPLRSIILLAFAALASVLLILCGRWACAYYRQPDPGTVVLDEYAGFALSVIFMPVPAWCGDDRFRLFLFTAGLYVLFRATDTLKLPPANWLERLPLGWGILLDDVAAGLQANIIAQIIVRFFLV